MLNPDRLPRVEGSHLVSAHDFADDITAGFDFPEHLRLVDSTIRKTYFTAGATTTSAGFRRIAAALGELGVREESINIMWSGSDEAAPQDLALLRAMSSEDFGFRLNVYADALLTDGRSPRPVPLAEVIDTLLGAGARILAPGIVQAPDAAAEERQREDLAEYFEAARAAGIETTITLAQVGLRDFDRLTSSARHAIELGATRLDLMDSTSSMSPEAMRSFVLRFRAAIGDAVPITMHMHDEFGLATAGALAAATAGASPDVSVNGMSYRCGFAPLEEVVLALEVLYGVDTGIRLDRIMETSRIVARESGIEVPALKPMVGGYAYLKHTPGDAAAAMVGSSSTFPPISHGLVPTRIGQELSWVWGGLSSDVMVRALATRVGIPLEPGEVAPLRRTLDAEVAAKPGYPRWLEPAEAERLFAEAVGTLRGAVDRPTAAELAAELVDDAGLTAHLVASLADVELPAAAAVVRRAVSELDDDAVLAGLHAFRPFESAPPSSGSASEREESGVAASSDAVRTAIARIAAEYAERFGFTFVIAATGLDGFEVLSALARRMRQDRAMEISETRGEVARILEHRMRRLVGEMSTV